MITYWLYLIEGKSRSLLWITDNPYLCAYFPEWLELNQLAGECVRVLNI